MHFSRVILHITFARGCVHSLAEIYSVLSDRDTYMPSDRIGLVEEIVREGIAARSRHDRSRLRLRSSERRQRHLRWVDDVLEGVLPGGHRVARVDESVHVDELREGLLKRGHALRIVGAAGVITKLTQVNTSRWAQISYAKWLKPLVAIGAVFSFTDDGLQLISGICWCALPLMA